MVGFALAIGATVLATLIFDGVDIVPDAFDLTDHALAASISNPDAFAFIVAVCAGTAGMLSLSTAKSGALIGVLISVTTIPAAANLGIALAYKDWDTAAGSAGQLARQPRGDPDRRHADALRPAPALPPPQAS